MAITFTVGKKYSSIHELKTYIKRYNEANYVKLIADDCKPKKAAAKKGIAKPITDSIAYNYIQYVCHYSGKHKSQKPKDVRKNTSCKIGCPFKLRFLATENGNELEVITFEPSHKGHENENMNGNLNYLSVCLHVFFRKLGFAYQL